MSSKSTGEIWDPLSMFADEANTEVSGKGGTSTANKNNSVGNSKSPRSSNATATVDVDINQKNTDNNSTPAPIKALNKHLNSAIKLTSKKNAVTNSPLTGPTSAGCDVFSPSDIVNAGEIAVTPPSDIFLKKDNGATQGAKRELAMSEDSVVEDVSALLQTTPTNTKKGAHNKRASTAWVHNTELEGEQVVMTTNNVLYFSPISKNGIKGKLEVTNFKMRFKPVDPSDSSKVPAGLFTIPLMTIDRMTLKKLDAVTGSKSSQQQPFQPTEIYMLCKDARHLRFEVHDRALSMDKLEMLFTAFVYPNNPKHLFAFDHKYPHVSDKEGTGWDVYQPKREWQRLGLIPSGDKISKASVLAPMLRETQLNNSYGICNTYPKVLLVPATIEDNIVRECSAFRTKGRLPVCTWVHSNGGSLWRSSQPRVGLRGNTSRADEAYLSAMAATSPRKGNKVLIIADARPKLNAIGNRARGGGFEGSNYRNVRYRFWDIGNIHEARGSFNKIASVAMNAGNDLNFDSAIADTQWYQHVRSILRASIYVVEQIAGQQRAVLIHCSDGWDRTPQTCSLAQLIMDPYFRTIRGFQVLIQKSFCSFGHRIHFRTGHGEKNGSDYDSDRGPILYMFIDAVYQLVNQFPTAFEFNESMLLDIVDNLWSCCFGTFLMNNERERLDLKIPKLTVSLWSYIDHERKRYLNPFYDKNYPKEIRARFPAVARQVCLWKSFFLRFSPVLPFHSCPCPKMSSFKEFLLSNAEAIEQHVKAIASTEEDDNEVENTVLLNTLHLISQTLALKSLK